MSKIMEAFSVLGVFFGQTSAFCFLPGTVNTEWEAEILPDPSWSINGYIFHR